MRVLTDHSIPRFLLSGSSAIEKVELPSTHGALSGEWHFKDGKHWRDCHCKILYLHGGAFAEGSEASALARRPVVTMHIDYLEQLLPYTALRAAVWFDEARKVFVVRFETDCNGTPGAVASTVVLCTVRQNANREHVEQEEQARSSRL